MPKLRFLLRGFSLNAFFPQKLEIHFKAVVQSLDDSDLPVRIQAALTLTEMILVHDEGAFASYTIAKI
jgi:hypothetical protein